MSEDKFEYSTRVKNLIDRSMFGKLRDDIKLRKIQRRKDSLIESCISTFVGFVLSLFCWYWPVPQVFGVDLDDGSKIGLVLFFTVISIIRGYVVRRGFEVMGKLKS